MSKIEPSVWTHVLNEFQESVYAEQVFCSIVTEMSILPQLKPQAPFEILHKENYETSYHRNTAAGNLSRLQSGENNPRLILLTVDCFIEAKGHDQKAAAALARLHANTPDDQAWLNLAEHWEERRQYWLARASDTLKTAIPSSMWEQGASMAEAP